MERFLLNRLCSRNGILNQKIVDFSQNIKKNDEQQLTNSGHFDEHNYLKPLKTRPNCP
jgi:hypothetical protein